MKPKLTQKLAALSLPATLALFLSCARAGDLAQEAITLDLVATTDPFIVIDYKATLAKLPPAEQASARSWLQELDALEARLDGEAVDMDTEAKLMVLNQRLDELLLKAKVAPVEIDLLEQLPEDRQLHALKLWRSIQREENTAMLQGAYGSAMDKQLERKYGELEAILADLDDPTQN